MMFKTKDQGDDFKMPNKQSSAPAGSTMPTAKDYKVPQAETHEKDAPKDDPIASSRRDLCARLVRLSDDQIGEVVGFLRVLDANRSNALTPVEDFIVSLPRTWGWAAADGRGLTPDDVAAELEAAREWFDDGLEITRDFNRRYAKAVAVEDRATSRGARTAREELSLLDAEIAEHEKAAQEPLDAAQQLRAAKAKLEAAVQKSPAILEDSMGQHTDLLRGGKTA